MYGLLDQVSQVVPSGMRGRVVRVTGMTIAACGMPAPVGAQCLVERLGGDPLWAQVVGFKDQETLLYPLSSTHGVRAGDTVTLARTSMWLPVGTGLLGRVIDARGQFVDRGPRVPLRERVPFERQPPPAVERPRIDQPLSTGVRAIDGLLTCGRGQRVGIFAGSGVGKSVTLGMMAKYTSADVNVVALIGERGREVNEFLERDLGPTGLAKSVVVVATSDTSPLLRVRCAFAATAVAEYFRDQGKDVLLIMDSVTRFALAQREIGLAAGEPPTTRGFPPSVFGMLPKLAERAGRAKTGSITAFYSVLVEADDANEPICDAMRGILDGHIWLSRRIATTGHYPAIDVLESISRLMTEVTPTEHRQAAGTVRALLAAYKEHRDLITIGAYRKGSDPQVDAAIELRDEIQVFLRQKVDESTTVDQAKAALIAIAQKTATKAKTK